MLCASVTEGALGVVVKEGLPEEATLELRPRCQTQNILEAASGNGVINQDRVKQGHIFEEGRVAKKKGVGHAWS